MMNIGKHLQWNPAIISILFALMCYRAWVRGFPLWSIVPLIIVAIWLILAIYRLLYQKRLSRDPLPVLSDEELVSRLGKDWQDRYSLRRFGGAWVSTLVFTTSLPVEILFRDKPDKSLPWSGWTIITGRENDWWADKDIQLSDVRRVLRQRPSLAEHLGLPVGTTLTLKDDGTYEKTED